MVNELRRPACARRGHHHLGRNRIKLTTRTAGGRGRQSQRIVERDPVAQLADQIAGVFRQKCHGHVLAATGGGDHHERFQTGRPGDHAHRPGSVEAGLEFFNGGREHGVIDDTPARAAGSGDDGRAARLLPSDFSEGVSETVFDGGVGNRSGGHEWLRAWV